MSSTVATPRRLQERQTRRRGFPGIGLVLLGVVIFSGYRSLTSPGLDSSEQLGYHAAILGLLMIIALRLGSLRMDNAHVWFLVAAMVVGHLPKLSALAGARDSPTAMARDHYELLFVTYADLTQALQTFTLALAIVTAFVIAAPMKRRYSLDHIPLPSPQRLQTLILVSAGLGIAALALAYVLGLGVLGQAVSRLPFGVDIVLNRTRSTVAPALALLALFYAIRLRCYERTAVTVVIGLAVASAFTTTSRGTIFFAALSIFLMYIFAAEGRSRRRVFLTVGVVVLVGLLTFPIISALRAERITGQQVQTSTSPLEGVQDSAQRVIIRAQGADGLLFLQRTEDRAGAASLSEKFSGSALSLSPYYTRNIVGVDTRDDFRSPGVLGACLLIAGPTLLPFTLLLFFSVTLAAGRFLGDRGVPAVSAVLIVGYIIELNEGILAVRPAIFFVLTVLALALVHRGITNQPLRLAPNRAKASRDP